MNRTRRSFLATGRFVAVLAFVAALPACSDDRDWDDLSMPQLIWAQQQGSWEQPSSLCMHVRVVDAEWNAWRDDWCEEGDGEVSPLGATTPAARDAIRRGFLFLKLTEPRGRSAVPCPTSFRHHFIIEEPIPMLEEPTTSTDWEVCGGTLDEIADLEEPFASIARAFLER
jgi:hypothetical protein